MNAAFHPDRTIHPDSRGASPSRTPDRRRRAGRVPVPGARLLLVVVLGFLSCLVPGVAAPEPKPVPVDFEVRSPVDGRVFRSVEARGKYVAIHFLLETECPYCLAHVREFAERAAAWSDLVQVFLKPDGDEEIRRWATRLGKEGRSSIPVHRDPGAELAKKYRIPGGYRFHGREVHYPALVVLGPDGSEVFRYVGKTNADRMSFAEFRKRWAEWHGEPAPTSPRAEPSRPL
ncbi:MAG: redoxin domain-containing protein [Verrucomicrobiales bacterium]|nr:redoxin domain-containing protein [Verrucomicrobiales bacterium]